MRGISTDINTIRQNVFSEIAKLSYEYDSSDTDFFKKMEHIPYRIIPGEESTYRDSVFLERAIVNERMRLAMGLPGRKANRVFRVNKGRRVTRARRVIPAPLGLLARLVPLAQLARTASPRPSRLRTSPAGIVLPSRTQLGRTALM